MCMKYHTNKIISYVPIRSFVIALWNVVKLIYFLRASLHLYKKHIVEQNSRIKNTRGQEIILEITFETVENYSYRRENCARRHIWQKLTRAGSTRSYTVSSAPFNSYAWPVTVERGGISAITCTVLLILARFRWNYTALPVISDRLWPCVFSRAFIPDKVSILRHGSVIFSVG